MQKTSSFHWPSLRSRITGPRTPSAVLVCLRGLAQDPKARTPVLSSTLVLLPATSVHAALCRILPIVLPGKRFWHPEIRHDAGCLECSVQASATTSPGNTRHPCPRQSTLAPSTSLAVAQ